MGGALPLSFGARTMVRGGGKGGGGMGVAVASIKGKEYLSAIYGSLA